MFWLETLGSRGAGGVTASYFTGPLTLVLHGYSYRVPGMNPLLRVTLCSKKNWKKTPTNSEATLRAHHHRQGLPFTAVLPAGIMHLFLRLFIADIGLGKKKLKSILEEPLNSIMEIPTSLIQRGTNISIYGPRRTSQFLTQITS